MIIIYGPTGVGKTELSLLLSQYLPIEIINMDIGSLYAPLTIGTAKPDWKQSSIPHHLFDIIADPASKYSVMDYRSQVYGLIKEIKKRKRVPVLVGGSGFYLKSLFFPAITTNSQGIYSSNLPTDQLWHQLNEIDPQRAACIDKNDRYRIQRALAIWFNTGTLPSLCAPVFDPVDSAYIIHLTRNRSDVYARINARVKQMINDGWYQEVALLDTEWKEFIVQKKVIGYDDILNTLDADESQKEQVVVTIQTKTRNYAKRQETFWRMLNKQLHEVDPSHSVVMTQTLNLTYTNVELYIKQLLQEVSTFLERKGIHD